MNQYKDFSIYIFCVGFEIIIGAPHLDITKVIISVLLLRVCMSDWNLCVKDTSNSLVGDHKNEFMPT